MNARANFSNPHESAIQIDSEHCRAICDEIGERLRLMLGREMPELPLRLQLLLNQLAEHDHETSPSIAPSIDDMVWQRIPDCGAEEVMSAA
jgi:hypothetical protein